MAKENVRVLPYLSKDAILDRDRYEAILDRDLSNCSRGSEFDVERAEHLLNDAVVSIFDVEYKAYRDKPGYESSWIPDIMQESLYRILVHAENYYWKDLPSLYEALKKTVLHHLAHDSILGSNDERGAVFPIQKKLLPGKASSPPTKMSRSITSPSAARKVEQFIGSSAMTLTQFAGKVQADERTIRRFRRTGTVEKTVLARVAAVMKTSVEKLLE